jgi:hypothetical protein
VTYDPLMEVDLSPSIATVGDALATLNRLVAAGCRVTDELLSCRVEVPAAPSPGVPHADLFESLSYLSDSHLVFEDGPLFFELGATPGSPLDFLNVPAGDPSNVFEDSTLEIAQRAWQGDVGAATSLPGNWRGGIDVHLQIPFEEQVPRVAWRVVRTLSVLTDAFAAYPWWRTSELIREKNHPVIVVVASEKGLSYATPSLRVASFDTIQGESIPTGLAARRRAVQSGSGSQHSMDIVLPEELIPAEQSSIDERLRQALEPKAEAAAWAWLSNAVAIDDASTGARLEFFGYRRKSFEVDSQGYVPDEGRAYDAYRWATVEESPDRVLAIRQVVSLQDGNHLPTRPADVVTAAEPLYRALRSGEVAAVLETQRQARSIAIDTSRQAAEVAQAAAKSAAERTIASLAAVAGIAIAHATTVLSAADARGIATGIALLFVFLALWAILVEGPPMRGIITSLSDDLPKIGSLLTERQLREVLEMTSVEQAKKSVLRIQLVTPLVYLVGAVLALGVAHFRFGLRWP